MTAEEQARKDVDAWAAEHPMHNSDFHAPCLAALVARILPVYRMASVADDAAQDLARYARRAVQAEAEVKTLRAALAATVPRA